MFILYAWRTSLSVTNISLQHKSYVIWTIIEIIVAIGIKNINPFLFDSSVFIKHVIIGLLPITLKLKESIKTINVKTIEIIK